MGVDLNEVACESTVRRVRRIPVVFEQRGKGGWSPIGQLAINTMTISSLAWRYLALRPPEPLRCQTKWYLRPNTCSAIIGV